MWHAFRDEDEIDFKADELRKKLQERKKKRMIQKIAESTVQNVRPADLTYDCDVHTLILFFCCPLMTSFLIDRCMD